MPTYSQIEPDDIIMETNKPCPECGQPLDIDDDGVFCWNCWEPEVTESEE